MTSLIEQFNNSKSPVPIILFGSPRSGTTYLLEIINQHPNISITYEARVFRWLYASQVRLLNDEAMIYKNKKDFVESANKHGKLTIQEFYQQISPEHFYWGDKNPFYGENSDFLENIERFFPGSYYVHIIRDPRDVITSLMRKQMGGKPWSTFDKAIKIWLQHATNGSRFGEQNPDANYFEIRYEDIVGDDVQAARQIFDFLDIEISDSVIDFCQKQLESRTILSGPTRDLGANGAQSSDWSSFLSLEQQLECLERTGAWLTRLGYLSMDELFEQKNQLRKQLRQSPSKSSSGSS
ncbi:MAG: sulfotransferase [Gammaproteobacteria bacterium]|nr:sulfotransferase [Gammaproteobacteria bacterium]